MPENMTATPSWRFSAGPDSSLSNDAETRPTVSLDITSRVKRDAVVHIRVGRADPQDPPPTLEQRSGIHTWRPVTLTTHAHDAAGSFPLDVLPGQNLASLRIDPHARPAEQGTAIPVDITVREGSHILGRERLRIDMTALTIVATAADQPADDVPTMRRDGEWKSVKYTITNHARSDVPATRMRLELTCEPDPERCPAGTGLRHVLSAFRAQWRDSGAWHALDTSREMSVPTGTLPPGSSRTFEVRLRVGAGQLDGVRELELRCRVMGPAADGNHHTLVEAVGRRLHLR
ncbi:hypothetical protein [Streptomyces sp. NPDC005009]